MFRTTNIFWPLKMKIFFLKKSVTQDEIEITNILEDARVCLSTPKIF